MSATLNYAVCSHQALLTINLSGLLVVDSGGIFSWWLCRRKRVLTTGIGAGYNNL